MIFSGNDLSWYVKALWGFLFGFVFGIVAFLIAKKRFEDPELEAEMKEFKEKLLIKTRSHGFSDCDVVKKKFKKITGQLNQHLKNKDIMQELYD